MFTSELVQSEAAEVHSSCYPRAFMNLDGGEKKNLVSKVPTQNAAAEAFPRVTVGFFEPIITWRVSKRSAIEQRQRLVALISSEAALAPWTLQPALIILPFAFHVFGVFFLFSFFRKQWFFISISEFTLSFSMDFISMNLALSEKKEYSSEALIRLEMSWGNRTDHTTPCTVLWTNNEH